MVSSERFSTELVLNRPGIQQTSFNNRQTDRHFYLISEKIRYQGEEIGRKIFESCSPAKNKVEQAHGKRVLFHRILDMYLQRQ